jgi:hypothetical protein
MSVTIFGILNIGFAALGFLGLLIAMVMPARTNGAAIPMLKEMYENPTYISWMKISIPLGGIVHLALLAAGIGLLLLQNWARIMSICYGIYAILACLVGGVVTLNIVMPIMRNNSGGPQGFFAIAMLIFMMGATVVGLVYPILLLIFMTRPKVVAAFLPDPASVV